MLFHCFKLNSIKFLLLICIGILLHAWGYAAPNSTDALAAPHSVQPTEHYLLLLNTQAETAELSADLKSRGILPKDRHQAVVEELRSVAEISQPPVMEILEQFRKEGFVLSYKPFFVSNIIAVECVPHILPYLEQIPGVTKVDLDAVLEMVEPVTEPNDSRDPHSTLDEANGLYQIRANKVWELGFSGNGVLVANIDTGVDGDHPALAQHWRGSFGYPPEECWLDLVSPYTVTPDGHQSHGTQTMGIICGMEPGDTVGVAWGATFIGAEIEIGMHLTSHALQALEWMLDPDGNPNTFNDVPRVISNSWGFLPGSNPCTQTFYTALDNCEAAGIAIVWAAGNEGPSYESIRIPADRAETPYNSFAVGGYDGIINDIYAESSRGPSPCSTDPELRIKPEVIAPARNVRSTILNSGYGFGSGTSFAVPHVAGVMALMLEANPFLDPDSLKELIALTAVDMNDWGNDNISGHGILDAYMAVYAAITGMGWIEGVITDELGVPVQAEIYLPEHPHHFTSDASGHFIFALPAYLPVEIQVVVPTQEIYTAWVLAEPQDTLVHDIDLIASLNGTLAGTVIDCEGRPAIGAQVEILNSSVPDDYTDANGRFLFSLPAGFYHVRASSPECGQTIVNNIQVITSGVTDIEIILPLNPNFVCSPPDECGYYVCDSNDPQGPMFDWSGLAPDEGGNGVQFNLYDDSSEEIMLPFTVTFYGQTYDRMWINANGNVSFGYDLYNYYNTALPLLEAPAIFGFWDDLDDTIDGPGGSIQSWYEPENGAYIVEWYQVPRFRPEAVENGRASVEIWIYDPDVVESQSGHTVVDVMYGEIDSANTATVGLDAADGSCYLPYVFDGQYETHATPIENGLAIRFTDSEVIDLTPSLMVSPATLELSLDPGDYIDTVITLTNQGAGPLGYRVAINESQYGGNISSKTGPPALTGPVRASDPKGEVYVPPKGYEPMRMPLLSNLDQGGPDEFGYYWIDSRDAGGPPYEFTDISTIGTPVGAMGDDTTSGMIELPWEFEFYDQRFKKYTVNSNGFISFWSIRYGAATCQLNEEPFRAPFYIIAPFWIDLDPTAGGSITSYFDDVADRYIIQWTDIRRFNRPNDISTFQIVLYADGMIDIAYELVPTHTLNGVIGIKGGHVGHALPVRPGQDYLANGMMLRFYREEIETVSCRILDHSFGTIPPLGSVDVPIRITNNDQFNGSFSWSITIKSTDPAAPYRVVNTFMITSGTIDADLTARRLDDTITLNWKPFPTSFYCIYSGGPEDNELTHFEGMTPDTFFVIPVPEDEARFFEVRLCTAAAADQDSE